MLLPLRRLMRRWGMKGIFFDFRDGTRVERSEYLRKSSREREDMQDAEEEHFERLDTARAVVHAADVRIAGLARAYDESAENDEYVFDHRDGSQVHISEYQRFSREERAGIQRARLERSERMGDTWANGGYL